MGYKVDVNRHGNLRFRLYWNGMDWTEGSTLTDTPKNRDKMQARAFFISEAMDLNTFDYLKWFPTGIKRTSLDRRTRSSKRLYQYASFITSGLQTRSLRL